MIYTYIHLFLSLSLHVYTYIYIYIYICICIYTHNETAAARRDRPPPRAVSDAQLSRLGQRYPSRVGDTRRQLSETTKPVAGGQGRAGQGEPSRRRVSPSEGPSPSEGLLPLPQTLEEQEEQLSLRRTSKTFHGTSRASRGPPRPCFSVSSLGFLMVSFIMLDATKPILVTWAHQSKAPEETFINGTFVLVQVGIMYIHLSLSLCVYIYIYMYIYFEY